MTEKLIFWAQALDNASPDHIEMRGHKLSPDDNVQRQKAVSLVSSVVKAGSRIFDRQGVQLTEDGRHFVVEVPSAERDDAGRTAPIVSYGDYDLTAVDAVGACPSLVALLTSRSASGGTFARSTLKSRASRLRC